MSDISKLSNEELISLYEKKKQLSSLSDEQLLSLYNNKSSGALDTAGKIAKEAISPDSYPVYGATAGAIAGSAFGPIGTVVGAGLGQVGGASLRDALKSLSNTTIENELRLPTSQEVAKLSQDLGLNFVQGAGSEAGGQLVGKGVGAAMQTPAGQFVAKKAGQAVDVVNDFGSMVANKIRPPQVKLNAKEIIEAGKTIGVDVTPGMLDETDFVSRLEYTLANSPSWLGQSVKSKQQAIAEALKSNIENVTKEATSLSSNQLGNQVKAGMIGEVGQRLDPAAAAFQEVAESTKNIPLNKKSIEAVTRNIINLPEYRLFSGKGLPGQMVDALQNATNANDVKTIMTVVNEAINNPSTNAIEKRALIAMKDKFSNLESNSIMRSAISLAKEGGMREATGKKIGSEIVDTLKSARKEYRALSTDLQAVAKDAGIKVINPQSFINAVEELPSEKIQDKFFNVDNNRLLLNIKQQFPNEFDLLKQGKISEILQASKNNTQGFGGQVSAQKFMTQMRNLSPEAQALMFSDDAIKTINAIDTIQKNLPKNFNPSSSGTQAGWQDAIIQNLKDIPDYILYKGSSNNMAKNIRGFMLKVPRLLELSKSNPKSFELLASRATAAFGQSLNFPMTLSKNGYEVTVQNEQDMQEATSEGWKPKGAK